MVDSLNILVLDSNPPRNIEEAVCLAAKEAMKTLPAQKRIKPRVIIETKTNLAYLPLGYEAYLINAQDASYDSISYLRQKQPQSKIFVLLSSPAQQDYTQIADKIGYAPRLKDIKELLFELIKN